MFRPYIILKKYLFTKPKWKILRIYTKQIKRRKIEELLSILKDEAASSNDILYQEYLRGKIEILNIILK
jgi:hypothetical protein